MPTGRNVTSRLQRIPPLREPEGCDFLVRKRALGCGSHHSRQLRCRFPGGRPGKTFFCRLSCATFSGRQKSTPRRRHGKKAASRPDLSAFGSSPCEGEPRRISNPKATRQKSNFTARPLSLRQLSLRRRAKTYQQSADNAVMMRLREPEDCDAKLRATPRGAPTPGSFARRCRSAQRSTQLPLSPLCDLSSSSVQHNPQATRS